MQKNPFLNKSDQYIVKPHISSNDAKENIAKDLLKVYIGYWGTFAFWLVVSLKFIPMTFYLGALMWILGGVSAILLVIFGIICAAIIISSFKILVASLAFKFKRSGPLLQFIYNFTGFTKYPLKIYPGVIRAILTFVIPLGLCLFYPFENLFAPIENPLSIAGGMLVFTIIFASICIFVWTRMVKQYESTGT